VKSAAVFLDRDGTINEQMGYINHPSRFVILPGVAEAVKLLNEKGFLTIIVSNQSGVARGYFPRSLVDEVHEQMKRSLGLQGARIDGIFFCPHHPEAILERYRLKCDCRKPRTGLIDQARKCFDIDMAGSYVVGDRSTDLELANRLNLKGILVKTGYGMGEIEHVLPKKSLKPHYIAGDLLDAAQWIAGSLED